MNVTLQARGFKSTPTIIMVNDKNHRQAGVSTSLLGWYHNEAGRWIVSALSLPARTKLVWLNERVGIESANFDVSPANEGDLGRNHEFATYPSPNPDFYTKFKPLSTA